MIRPSAILFDWDSTLVSTEMTIRRAFNATLTAFGREPWSDEVFVTVPHLSTRDSFPVIFEHDCVKANQYFYEHYLSVHLKELSLLPGVTELLDLASDHKIPLGIVSNKNGDILRKEIEFLGWENRFFSVIGSGDTSEDKPSCVPVLQALKEGNHQDFEKVWFVGDSPIDLECARKTGCYPVILKTGPQTPTLSPFEKGKVVENCLQLKKFLSNILF